MVARLSPYSSPSAGSVDPALTQMVLRAVRLLGANPSPATVQFAASVLVDQSSAVTRELRLASMEPDARRQLAGAVRAAGGSPSVALDLIAECARETEDA